MNVVLVHSVITSQAVKILLQTLHVNATVDILEMERIAKVCMYTLIEMS